MRTAIKIFKNLVLFVVYGAFYIFIELAARGYSHWTMFFVGGLCGVIVGGINQGRFKNMGLLWQSLIGAVVITAVEFTSGMILNIILELDIWNYSSKPFNLFGQVCLINSVYWIGLSVIGILLDDFLRRKLFKEKKKTYTIL